MRRSNFQLRPAISDDEDVAFKLFEQAQTIHADAEPELFRPPERSELFDRFFEETLNDPDQHLVMACVDENVVGYILYSIGTRTKNLYQPERRVVYIHQLVVDENYRKAGCGSLLVEHAKQEARHRNITLVGVDFWSFNDSARACFEKAGFKVKQEYMWLA